MANTDLDGTTQPSAAASPAYARYALAVLFVVMTLNFLDRQVIAILAEPIKRDLGLSDTQVGLMTGLSFALFYTTLGLPIAILADRWNRSRIIAISLAVWSAMTVACGLAANFIQLFLARIGVGIGEAGSAPASHSLIADLFPPERRAGALGVFAMSIPIGSFLAYAGGGWFVQAFDWRTAFLVAGAPGLFIAVLVWFTVREPRGQVSLLQAIRMPGSDISLADAWSELAGKPTYWHLIAAGALVQFIAFGLASFYGALFVRQYQLGYAELGWNLGVMVGITGAFGAWFGGVMGDRLVKRSRALALIAPGVALALTTPFMVAALYAPTADIAFVLFAAHVFSATFYYGPTFAAVQSLARAETRAVAMAFFTLIASLLGMGLGPVFVGVLSDIGAGANADAVQEAEALRQAIVILSLFNIWAGLHFLFAARTVNRDVESTA